MLFLLTSAFLLYALFFQQQYNNRRGQELQVRVYREDEIDFLSNMSNF